MSEKAPPTIAVIIPCHNEETTIAEVVSGFRASLPHAMVYVFDNASTDGTAEKARAAGAVVSHHAILGKGNVVRRMLADVDADIYVMTDGDLTYDPEAAPGLIQRLLDENLDMVVGARQSPREDPSAYRLGHRFGNTLLNWCVGFVFGQVPTDLLSGFRVLSRRFVKSFPIESKGFEIETEMTVHALHLALPFVEMQTPYRARPLHSNSKLRTFQDGLRILGTIFLLLKEQRPVRFFGTLFVTLTLLAWGIGYGPIKDFIDTGMVARFPSAILAASLQLMAVIFLICGILLDSLSRSRREYQRLAYLAQDGPWSSRQPLSPGAESVFETDDKVH